MVTEECYWFCILISYPGRCCSLISVGSKPPGFHLLSWDSMGLSVCPGSLIFNKVVLSATAFKWTRMDSADLILVSPASEMVSWAPHARHSGLCAVNRVLTLTHGSTWKTANDDAPSSSRRCVQGDRRPCPRAASWQAGRTRGCRLLCLWHHEELICSSRLHWVYTIISVSSPLCPLSVKAFRRWGLSILWSFITPPSPVKQNPGLCGPPRLSSRF